MKRTFLPLFFLALGLATLRADLLVFTNLTTVSNTTATSSSIQTNTLGVNYGKVIISNGGLGSTGNYSGYRQVSVDNTNWYTVGSSYNPAITNASSQTISAGNVSFPIYSRFAVTSTNSVQVGAYYLSP